jgi:transposase
VLPLALLPAAVVVSVDGVVLDQAGVTLLLRTASATACCPVCQQPSPHVHSRYARTAHDLPYQGRPTTLHLTARKFFCRNSDCPRTLFCERLPDLLPPYARSTSRLTDSHRAIGLALGGEPGSRLAGQLGMPTSPDTLLRRIKQTATQQAPTPRVLGVDDWAIRKGHNYGTILVDLERGEVIDLLPGRAGTALQQWLKDHPGVEVVSRDRASAYAQAASEAAPNAMQVADRWHLLKNAREMLERFFERHRGKIQAVADVLMPAPIPKEDGSDQVKQEPPSQPEGDVVQPAPISSEPASARNPGEQAREAKRQRRVERYQQVRQRHGQGQSIRQIALEMNLSRNAVRRYLRVDHCPDWRPGQARRSGLDGFCRWIDEQVQAGRDNAAELHRELKAKGYEGSADSVRRFVSKRLAALGKKRERANAAQPRSPPAPSARALAFEVLRAQKKRKAQEQARVEALRGIDEEFREVLALAEEFIALIRKEQMTPLTEWLAKAEVSVSPEMRGFAQGVRQDEAAVSAAMSQPWSNGPVEGQVNRLKVIKRQMYGRASFALLRLQVLNAA